MRLYLTTSGIGYCGKVAGLRKILRQWCRSSITLREFVTKSLH